MTASNRLNGGGISRAKIVERATEGTDGNDFFPGTSGDDVINGNGGDDTINDGGGGNDVLNGGDGDDLIRIQRFGGVNNNVTVNAGDGNDRVFIDASTGGFFTIDLGAGDDLLGTFRDGTYGTDITLGEGVDTVDFDSFTGLTFRDFTPGDAGDIFTFNRINFRAVGYDSSQNPFSSGYLTLTQEGADSVLTFYRFGGASGESLVIGTFQNTLVENFTAVNFGGFDPSAGGAGEPITGTEGDDTLDGTAASEVISGLGGDDTIDGGEGDDTIEGGAGNDTITGGFGNDTIRGGDDDDVITDAFGANIIYGDGGNDTINITGFFGSSFTGDPHQIFGGTGNDTVNWGYSASEGLILDLGEGDDRINFSYPVRDNELTLGTGSDIVDINGIQSISSSFPLIITDFETGDGGDQLLWGDFIRQRTGNFGTPDFNPFSFREAELVQVGNDTHIVDGFTLVIFRNTQASAFTAFNLEFDPNAPIVPGEDFTGTEGRDFWEGTPRDDTATGLGDDDSLEGRGGNDQLDGGAGNDLLDGGEGDDILIGGDGNDEIYGRTGADTIDGGDGDDLIDAGFGGGANTINAGAGNDTVVYSGPDDTYDGGEGFDTLEFIGGSQVLSFAVVVDFTDQPVNGNVLIGGRLATGFENILYLGEYSNFDDTIIFGANFDFGQTIWGGNGNDTLTGTNFEDQINGGDGDDVLTGLGGNDYIEDAFGNNFIDAGDGDDEVIAGLGNDTIFGGLGNDRIEAGAGNDTIDGGDGDDEINAGTGTDIVDAGAGNDRVIIGDLGPGDDLDGGSGTDTLQIGPGSAAIDFEYDALSSGPTSAVRNFELFEFALSQFDDRVILGPTFTDAVTLDGFDGNDQITGGSGNDTLTGGDGSDILAGGDGDDEIFGGRLGFDGDEYDELYGGAGADRLSGFGYLDGGDGDDFVSGSGELFGGDGDDTVNSFGDGDIVRGGAGNDRIALRGVSATVLLEAGLNADSIDGGSGFYTVQATADNTSLQWTGPLEQNPTRGVAVVDGIDVISSGGFDNFRIVGSDLNDEIFLTDFGNSVTLEGDVAIHGLGGNDRIIGSASNDLIFGDEGDDQIEASGGDDVMHGGTGNDRYTVNSLGDQAIELVGEGDDTVITLVNNYVLGANIETLIVQPDGSPTVISATGNDNDNTIIGNGADNELFGAGGNDRIEGGVGNDLLDGGLGDDWLIGGTGNDFLLDYNGYNILDGGEGNDTIQGDGMLIGGSGDDQLTGGGNADVLFGGTGINRLDGGGGDDTASYRDSTSGVTVDLRNTGQQNIGQTRFDTLISIENVIGSDLDDTLTGDDGANVFTGGGGGDVINGGANIDIAVFSGDLSQYTIVQFTDRSFGVAGPDGEDLLVGIEYAQFDDQTLRLLPGLGVSVNFETADPSVYQSAMNAIRDFDGNNLGGSGSWLRIGSADVNGDGDVDQILVNDAIGRFATVGTAPDGLVYFEDFSWAGETRVAGIYIDPLVQSGEVVAGSDNDSQRRFQNDLQIENINRVLGADDYDGDGVWEVYFALTDGTAYLRALMHSDGNIRYANYQSEQEVIDYLTANGYDESTFGDWFPNATSTADTVTFVNEAPKIAEIETLARPAEMHARPMEEWQPEYFG